MKDGNVITGGGVTAGIDFGLSVVAEIAGETTARRIQLGIEYDPARRLIPVILIKRRQSSQSFYPPGTMGSYQYTVRASNKRPHFD